MVYYYWFNISKNIPPQGYFELRTDHLLLAVNTEGICIIDEDKYKLSWVGSFHRIEWECTPDSFSIEYTQDNVGGVAPKKIGSTLITPQAHLIDSLASRAIYIIEKAQKAKSKRKSSIAPSKNSNHPNGEPIVTNGKEKSDKRNTIEKRNSKAMAQDLSPSEKRASKMSTSDNPPSFPDSQTAYLKAVNEARKISD